MEFRRTSELTPHPVSLALYGNNHIEDIKQSIAEQGILVPLTITSADMIISGHRRWHAALSLGLAEVPVVVKDYDSELDEKVGILEFNRQREKTFSQKMAEAELIKDIVAEKAQLRVKANQFGYGDDRTVAAVDGSGTSATTVLDDECGDTRDILGQRVGIGGGTSFRYADKVWQKAKEGDSLAQELIQKLDSGDATIKGAYKEIKRIEVAQERELNRKIVVASNAAPIIKCGDFRELSKELADESIDLILTDPPYPAEFRPLWRDLSKMAARVLKPGGFLIAYSGQNGLPDILNMLSENLEYYWLGMLYHQGNTGQRFEVNMWNRAKPILYFCKPPKTKQETWCEDVIVSERSDKDFHEWGQNAEPFMKLLDNFSKPDAVVLEPYMGGGATVEACIQRGRKVIAYEIDREKYELVRARLS